MDQPFNADVGPWLFRVIFLHSSIADDLGIVHPGNLVETVLDKFDAVRHIGLFLGPDPFGQHSLSGFLGGRFRDREEECTGETERASKRGILEVLPYEQQELTLLGLLGIISANEFTAAKESRSCIFLS